MIPAAEKEQEEDRWQSPASGRKRKSPDLPNESQDKDKKSDVVDLVNGSQDEHDKEMQEAIRLSLLKDNRNVWEEPTEIVSHAQIEQSSWIMIMTPAHLFFSVWQDIFDEDATKSIVVVADEKENVCPKAKASSTSTATKPLDLRSITRSAERTVRMGKLSAKYKLQVRQKIESSGPLDRLG